MKITRKFEVKSKDEGEEEKVEERRRRHCVICGKQIIVRAANHSARWPTSVRGLVLDENPPIYWPTFVLRLAFERHHVPQFWNSSYVFWIPN